jgi:hypothetical protein
MDGNIIRKLTVMSMQNDVMGLTRTISNVIRYTQEKVRDATWIVIYILVTK